MQTVREFGGESALLSLGQFWLATGPILAGVLLLTVLVVIWKRPSAVKLRSRAWEKLGCSGRRARHREMESTSRERTDIENVPPSVLDSQALHDPLPSTPYHPPPTPQPSRSGQGGSIPLVTINSPQPPPGSPPQQQPPSGAYSTSPTSTSNPNRASLPLSFVGK